MQRVKAETKTAGGIFLPEASVKELNEAKVLAVGPGGLDKNGKRVEVSVKPGDKVLVPQVSLFLFVGGWMDEGGGSRDGWVGRIFSGINSGWTEDIGRLWNWNTC